MLNKQPKTYQELIMFKQCCELSKYYIIRSEERRVGKECM